MTPKMIVAATEYKLNFLNKSGVILLLKNTISDKRPNIVNTAAVQNILNSINVILNFQCIG